MKTHIKLSGIESKSFDNGGTKHILLDGKTKYNFYATKRDGAPTKAMEGYDKMRPRVGDTLIAEVETEEKTFQDPKTRKDVRYNDNRILYFYEDGEELEKAQTPYAVPPAPGTSPSVSDIGMHQKLDEILSYLRPKAKPVAPIAPTAHPEDEIPVIQQDEDEEPIDISKVPF